MKQTGFGSAFLIFFFFLCMRAFCRFSGCLFRATRESNCSFICFWDSRAFTKTRLYLSTSNASTSFALSPPSVHVVRLDGKQQPVSPKTGSWRSDPDNLRKPSAGAQSENPFSTDGERGSPAPGTIKKPSPSKNPFDSGETTPASGLRQTPPKATDAGAKNPFASGNPERGVGSGKKVFSGGRGGGPPPLPPPRPLAPPFQPRQTQQQQQQQALISPTRRAAESTLLDGVLAEAVGLLQQAGRAVAALNDAYNAAYNASAAADGWGGDGHDAADLGEVCIEGGGGGMIWRVLILNEACLVLFSRRCLDFVPK